MRQRRPKRTPAVRRPRRVKPRAPGAAPLFDDDEDDDVGVLAGGGGDERKESGNEAGS